MSPWPILPFVISALAWLALVFFGLHALTWIAL